MSTAVLSVKNRRAEYSDPTDPLRYVPVVGTGLRTLRMMKMATRTKKFLEAKGVPRNQRILASASTGANEFLRSKRLNPIGASLFVVDRTGKGFVRELKRSGSIPRAARQGYLSSRYAVDSIKTLARKTADPAYVFAKSAKKTYNRLPKTASRKRRALAATRVGVDKVFESKAKKGVPKTLYKVDRKGKAILRGMRRRRIQRRRIRRSP